MKHIYSYLRAMLVMLLLVSGVGTTWGQSTKLFHEGFGNNSNSARAWNDSYKEQSGINAIYSSAAYTITNAKQSKNNGGSTNSGLMQSPQGTDAVFLVGPLDLSKCSNVTLSYKWKAASVKGTYSTHVYYSTTANGTYTEIENSAEGATTFVDVSVAVPTAALTSGTYIKVVFNTSNSQAVIDEFDLSGTCTTGDNVAVTSVTVNPTTATLNIGDNLTLSADVLTANATNKTVTWTSENESVATVDSNTGVVTAVAAGTATITATAGGQSGTCTVTVNAADAGGGEGTADTYTKVTGTTLTSGEYLIVGAKSTASFGLLSYGEVDSNGRLAYEANYSSLPNTISNVAAKYVWQVTVSGNEVTIYNQANDVYLGEGSTPGNIAFKSSQSDATTYIYTSGSTSYGSFSLKYTNRGDKYLGVNKSSDFWRNYATSTLAGGNGVVLTFYKKAGSQEKTTPALYFEPATYEATVGETFTATLVNTDDVEVSYSIEAEPSGCATINVTSGAVTCSTAGTATVIATSAETDQFVSTTATYTLNIVAANHKPVKYKKITSAAEFDLKGTYIIVYEDGNLAMGDVDVTKKKKGQPVDVTISEDKLIETSFVNKANYPYEVTFSNASEGKYYLNIADHKLTTSTKDNEKTNFTLTESGSEFVVEFTTNGDANIYSVNDRQISYYASSTAFGNYATSDDKSKIVQLYKKVETVAVGTAGWATFAPSSTVAMPDQHNVGVYYVTAVGTDNVATTSDAKEDISDGYVMAAGTGVLVKATDGTNVCFPVSSETDNSKIKTKSDLNNLLVGVTEETDMTDVSNAYIFTKKGDKVGFYVCTGGKLAANKCYLQWSGTQSSAPQFILLPGDDTATAIDEVFGGEDNAPMYDLQGRRVTAGYRGIVITNGKKLMTK